MTAPDPVQAVAEALIDHTRLRPPSGECSCGHEVPLGHSFAMHQAEAAVADARPLIAAETLHAMAGDLAALTHGKNSEGLAGWQDTLRSAYELAIEESEGVISARADDLEADQ